MIVCAAVLIFLSHWARAHLHQRCSLVFWRLMSTIQMFERGAKVLEFVWATKPSSTQCDRNRLFEAHTIRIEYQETIFIEYTSRRKPVALLARNWVAYGMMRPLTPNPIAIVTHCTNAYECRQNRISVAVFSVSVEQIYFRGLCVAIDFDGVCLCDLTLIRDDQIPFLR